MTILYCRLMTRGFIILLNVVISASWHPVTAVWMSAAIPVCLSALAFLAAAHFGSLAIAAWRSRRGAAARALPAPAHAPGVTVVRPVCGLENYIEETLRSTFLLDYPRFEILFCVARADDAAVPLLRRLIADYPWIDARLLLGDERISANPKLNNMVKGWREAAHDYVVFADSNVLMPRDYVQRLLARFDAHAGLVCSPPVGSRPENFWAELECAFLNTYQARWQLGADAAGYGYAQGKTMMWRRADLEAAGGVRALACELAEDAASTKAVRAAGRSVRLVDAPFPQPLGWRHFSDVWRRQARWAQLRRASFPLVFIPEILSGGALPFALIATLAVTAGISLPGALVAAAALWYGGELALAMAAGWPASLRSIAAAVLRDLMIPVLWTVAWSDAAFVWRGNVMTVAEDAAAANR